MKRIKKVGRDCRIIEKDIEVEVVIFYKDGVRVGDYSTCDSRDAWFAKTRYLRDGLTPSDVADIKAKVRECIIDILNDAEFEIDVPTELCGFAHGLLDSELTEIKRKLRG